MNDLELRNELKNEFSGIQEIEEYLELINYIRLENEAHEFLTHIENETDNFYTKDGNYLFVHSDNIEEYALEVATELINEIYITADLEKSFLFSFIDVPAAAQFLIDSDGYGVLLAGYDHNENKIGDYYYFRVN
jgi:hypothetical protein